MSASRRAKAYLIGAGPGDPGLLTLRGAEALADCDVVLVDELVHPEVLRHAKNARIVHAGKRCGRPSSPQELTTRLLVSEVRRGRVVGRLKGGDPYVFGRGGEEALALARAGLAFEVIPGVSSALGAGAYAGIPLTHRGLAHRVTFIAGHRADGGPGRLGAEPGETLVLYMCQRTLQAIVRDLVRDGLPCSTPIAIVRGATHREQHVYTGTLEDVTNLSSDWYAQLDQALPTLAIVGDVVSLSAELASTRPTPIHALSSTRSAVGF